MTKEKTFSTVEFPEALSRYVLEETQYCGRHVTKRKKGNRTHHLAKVLGFYLLLKAESPGAGLIQNYTKQLPVLASNFNISKRSFFMYLKQLETMKLITRENKNIRVAGWDQLSRVLEINTKKRTQIQFNYGTGQKIHWWFAALEIKSNQELQADTVWKKVNKNSEDINSLRTALNKRGFDTTKIKDQYYTLERLSMLWDEDFISGTEIHDVIIQIRPDLNRSCHTIAEAWNTSPQVVQYWKMQMYKQKIIDVTKLDTLISEWKLSNRKVGKNKFCHVGWDAEFKQRTLRKCDQITVIKRWEAMEFIKQNAAA